MFSLDKLFGDEHAKTLKKMRPIIERINALESELEELTLAQLGEKTTAFRDRLEAGETLDELLPEAFAAVREAAKRTLGQRHFDVQLLGGIAMHRGNIAEMGTGEGKTLVATLPVYLNALSGKGAHVVTVNDYLARRDAVWMGQIYAALGLSVGVINSDGAYLYDAGHKEVDQERDELGSFKVQYDFLRPCERKDAYQADVTYGTNNEFGFDFLRDNIAYAPEELRQREYHFAIIDEIDSILIDEARTPLIISAPAAESESLYATFSNVAGQLKPDEDYEIDEKRKQIALTDKGIEKAEQILGIENIYTERGVKYVHHLETAVKAKALFQRDKEYVVRDGEVVIVDEFTGRLQPGRRWSEGLHQAIEAKEGVKVQRESRTVASITFQNYFRMYDKLAGMTGTAQTSSEEFYSVYKLEVIPIPPNVPSQRLDRNDLIYQTERGKFTAIARKVKELQEKGQPVLIGTVSVEKNEMLAQLLKKENVPHEVLNAKNHEHEGEIIAQAGTKGRVTIATNMAGRGVDIKLGGVPASDEEYEEVKRLGGLFVLGTERHEARRIDNQLRGRAGRQGDPGETQFFVSMEDTLMRVFAPDTVKNMMGRLGIPEDEHIENKMITRSLESAQNKIENFNFDARKQVLAYDDVLNQQRHAIYGRRYEILIGERETLDRVLEEVVADDEELSKTVAERKEAVGEDEFYRMFRLIYLQTTDMLWMEHLEVMEYMRSSVNLRAYGQRDPLIEYRKEGLRLFRELEDAIDEQVARLIPNIGAGSFAQEEQKLQEVHKDARLIGGGGEARPAQQGNAQRPQAPRESEKIGRNEQVTVTNGTETKTMKYKKAEPLLAAGWKLVEEK